MVRHRSPLAALELFHHELGDVFRINLPGFRPIMLVGPEAARFVLVTERDQFKWRAEGEPVTRLLRHGVLVEDGEAHDRLRRLMTPALHRRMLGGYVALMGQAVDEVSQGWAAGCPYDMLVEMRRVALLILMRGLFRVDFSRDMAHLWPAILKILAYISPGAWLVWRDIPRPSYKQALRQMDIYLYQIIQARRKAVGAADDLLGLLVSTPGMPDGLIRDQLLTMLIAGHDTSTALLAWTLYLLGEHREVMVRAQTEVDEVLGSAPPTLDALARLTYLEQVIQETLRLYPPIHLSMRTAATELEFQGYGIPAGSRVLFSIYLTQRHPAYWPNPAQFEPDRFGVGQHKARPHYVYLPFGGGPRNCIGLAFAQVEVKVVLARLLQRFSFRREAGQVHAHMGATLEPRPHVWMGVQPRTKGYEWNG
jgi:cytochrome P450